MTSILKLSILRAVAASGYMGALFGESCYWIVLGKSRKQAVKATSIIAQMMQEGVAAIPITLILAMTVGMMLAIQLIVTLEEFGAQSQVILAIAVSVTREFAPLITAILVAGRTASSLAARIGSMVVSQEIDALRVIGIEPIRYLLAPALIALVVMLPILTILADIVAIIGGGLFSAGALDMGLPAYLLASIDGLSLNDIMQGLVKSVIFGVLIAVIGSGAGFTVKGGAEGVGRATTKAVVLSITWIVITDMVFTWFLNR